MQSFHVYHNHAFHRAIKGELRLFELSVWLHTIGRSIVGIFIPVLLLKLGYGLTTVILYYLVFNAFDVPLNFLAEKSVEKIGARKTIMIAVMASIAFFSLLGIVPTGSWPLLFLLAFLDAIYDTFYWVAHLYLFLRSSHSRHSTGEETGMLASIRTLGSMMGPLIGALIVLFGSNSALLATSIVFFLLSLIPLARLRHADDYPPLPRMPVVEFLDQPLARKDYGSIFLSHVHYAVEGTLWPLFIFMAIGGTESVAYLAIILSLTKAALAYFTGTIRKTRRSTLLMTGALAIGLIWLLRLTTDLPSFAYVSAILVGFFALLIDVPLDSSIFERGRQSDSLRASTLRNACGMAGMLVLFLVVYLLVDVFKVAFITAAFAMFLLVFLTYLFLGTKQRGRRRSAIRKS